VELTARAAADRGFYTTLFSDGCGSSTRVAHEDALQWMTNGGLIKSRTVQEMLATIASVTPAVAAGSLSIRNYRPGIPTATDFVGRGFRAGLIRICS